jgi:hypothetical protein
MWTDKVHDGSGRRKKGHIIDFDESTAEIAFDFEINDPYSS